jgi:sugar-specific transcriptional regulator TrmB
MIGQEVVERLRLFNLTEYESRTYLALVARGPSTAKEIREVADIPYSREYDILRSLESRGFVESQPGRPRRFKAVEPEKVLERELKRRKKAVDSLLKYTSSIRENQALNNEMENVIWTLRGRNKIRGKMAEMIDAAKREILIIGRNPVPTPELEDVLKKARERGVKIKALGMFKGGGEEVLKRIGVEFYPFQHNHSRFFLVDDEELILASDDPADYPFALYNKNKSCINLYQNYFRHIWAETRKDK